MAHPKMPLMLHWLSPAVLSRQDWCSSQTKTPCVCPSHCPCLQGRTPADRRQDKEPAVNNQGREKLMRGNVIGDQELGKQIGRLAISDQAKGIPGMKSWRENQVSSLGMLAVIIGKQNVNMKPIMAIWQPA
jgi:hypothetical protein